MNFVELCEKYGSPKNITDEELYNYLKSPDVWEGIKSVSKEEIDESPLGIEVKRRAKQDLFFLAKYFLWESNPEGVGKEITENKVTEHTHRRLCDMFVKKDDSKKLADQDTVSKERIILYPRGSFKSTIDICDAVQWILNFPEIRILFLTAAKDLAVKMVDEVKGHFILREQNPSLMNVFFPEYCLPEAELAKENMFDFTCPVWKAKGVRRGEPTVMALSIESTMSGFHFDVMKVDDVVSNKNSESDLQCEGVIKNVHLNRKMLMPWGYLDMLGTRYVEADYYGDALAKNVGDIVTDSGPCWMTSFNKDTGLKVLIGRAWEPTPEAKTKLLDGSLTQEMLKEEHYNLLFPQSLTYKFLRTEQRRDDFTFEGQYNQNPRSLTRSLFTRPMLMKHTVPFNHVPISGPITQTWDFAFSPKKKRDYCTGATVIWNDKGEMYVLDLIRKRFTPDELAQAVVDFARKWRPFKIGIENAGGSNLLDPTIRTKAAQTGDQQVFATCAGIDWFKMDNQKDAKLARMGTLHPMMMSDRLWFLANLPFLEDLYNEFETCLAGGRHDDIPDVISQQLRYAPVTQQLIIKKELQTFSRADVGWNQLFEPQANSTFLYTDPETGETTWVEPIDNPIAVIPQKEPEMTADRSDGLDPILGAGL